MKIAIVRLSAMGDIIHSMIVLQFIKRAYPDVHIEWICEEAFAPILQANKHIDKIHTVTIKKAKKQRSLSLLWKNIKYLRTLDDYDQIIDMQGLLKSALVARCLGKNIHGFSKESIREKIASFFYKTTTKIPYHENTIVRNITLVAQALHFDFSEDDLKHPKPFIDANLALNNFFTTPYTVLVVGSTWASRNYPDDLWKELIAKKTDTNFIVIWGSQSEYQSAKNITELASNATIAPQTSLDGLMSILAKAQLVIGNDTGPTHLAWALGIASITLFGPTPVSRIYETPKNIALKSPSFVDPYKLNKQDFSIKEISTNQIIEAMEKLVNV